MISRLGVSPSAAVLTEMLEGTAGQLLPLPLSAVTVLVWVCTACTGQCHPK